MSKLEKLLRNGRNNTKLDVRLNADGTVDIFSEYESGHDGRQLAVLDEPSLEDAAAALAAERKRA